MGKSSDDIIKDGHLPAGSFFTCPVQSHPRGENRTEQKNGGMEEL